MGVEVVELYCGMTGMFPHDPEPRPEHLEELRQAVAAQDAHLGLAVDPDVDRLSMIDRGGLGVSEERTLVVASDYVLARQPGPVVVNLSTTLAMDRVTEAYGVALYRTPVGEANVVHKMLEVSAILGGEGNGGVILPALHAGRDALLGAALVLSAVAERGSLRACLDRYPNSHIVKEKLVLSPDIDDESLWEVALRELGDGGQLDSSDGLKYDLGDRWVHLRRSNTEHALRIIAEADDESSAGELVQQVAARLTAGA
jgi:phosphomannomutase